MRSVTTTAPHFAAVTASMPSRTNVLDAMASVAAAAMLASLVFGPWISPANPTLDAGRSRAGEEKSAAPPTKSGETWQEGETVVSAYIGAPWYYRSDVKLDRNNGTDIELKDMGWDGDALYFPIDGGARAVRWSGAFGTMVDFLHNKAVSRLGKGAHGRKIKDGVIETVETTGTLKGQPAPAQLRLTDLFERLEFTHGHNVLLLTGLLRLAPVTPAIRPYIGVGAGAAIPHVEVGFANEPGTNRTNEYQLAGPAAQLVAGLELRHGRGSYYLEYKFTWASIAAILSGDRSFSFKHMESLKFIPKWLLEPLSGLMEMPGDLFRQYHRWSTGEGIEGHLSTRLSAHQIVIGAGYVWPKAAPANP